MAESQLLAGTGVAILAVSAYLQSCNAARRRWIHLIVYTPETSVEAAWQRLEQMQKGSEGGQLLRPVIFAKLKGESWVPPTDAVPDRFGKPAVLALPHAPSPVCPVPCVVTERRAIGRHTSRPKRSRIAGSVCHQRPQCETAPGRRRTLGQHKPRTDGSEKPN